MFDTTASNTGHVTAACVTIQQALQRPLLWSGCRHHVGEVVLTHIFNDLQIETSKSPDISLFLRFRKNFDSLAHSDDMPLTQLDVSHLDEDIQTMIADWVAEVLEVLKFESDLRRDDYREFVELCLVYLGAEQSIKFKRPGALHKARWMAKLLYAIKMCLLEAEIQKLPPGTVTAEHQVKKLRDFVTFATTVYSSWWLTCSSVVDAPWNDLKLWQRLLSYKDVNLIVAESALKAFQRHFWYLTSEMVPLALFSNKVPTVERQALADSLLTCKPQEEMHVPKNRFGTGFGKPKFPTATRITESTTLADLVAQDSWFLLNSLQIDHEFLKEPAETWSHSTSYQASLKNIDALNVVNDCAERGVKLSSDFLSAAKSEEHYPNVLQVAEADRKKMPNLRKRKAKHDK